MEGDKVIFVFYTFYEGMEGTSWKYSRFPKGWKYIGGGGTIGKESLLYEREEQFSGPKISRNAMHYFLNKAFKEIHERGIIKRYTIRNSNLS